MLIKKIVRMKITLFALLNITFYSSTLYAQRDPCMPQCNVYFNDIFNSRCPSAEQVAKINNLTIGSINFNPDKITLGGPLCGDEAASLLKRYRDEDEKNEVFLRKRYCSAQEGWVLKEGRDCKHGGPPDCCEAPSEIMPWEKIDPLKAMQRFKAVQDKIFQQRLKEIVAIVKPCKIQLLNTTNDEFNNSYNVAVNLLNTFKEDNPSQAANHENTHGAKIRQLKSQFDEESNKGDNADIQKLKNFAGAMQTEENALAQSNERAEKNKENQQKELAAKTENAKKDDKKTDNKGDSDSGEKKAATTTYVESDYNREMRIRAEEQRKKDAMEDQAMGAMVAPVVAAMSIAALGNVENKDEDNDLSIYLKGSIGLAMQEIPVTSNMTYRNYSYSNNTTTTRNISEKSTTGNYSVNAGLFFAVLNNKFISLRVNPFIAYGMNAFSSGTSGDHISYGGGGALGFGGRFKILVKGEYEDRSGEMAEDYAYLGMDAIGYTSYNYSTLKYGVGVFLGFSGHDTFIEISSYKEELSFLKNIDAQVYSYEIELSFGLLAMSAQYAFNYPIAGEVKYPGTYKKEKEDLLTLSLYVPFKIFSAY